MIKPNENILKFERVYQRCHSLLKFGGLLIDNENRKKVLIFKLFLFFNVSWISTDSISQLVLLYKGLQYGYSFIELTFVAPCTLLCLISSSQSIVFMKKRHIFRDLLTSILLQLTISEQDTVQEKNNILKTRMNSVLRVINTLFVVICMGLSFFALKPIINILSQYYAKEKIYLTLPFLVLYPFDIQIIGYWLLAYMHVMWSGIVGAILFASPYFLCYACTATISCLFNFLCQDIKTLISDISTSGTSDDIDESIQRLVKIAKRHTELLRCVDLLEEIYSFTNLLNVVASSVLICLTAFNVMMLNDIILVLPFLNFLGLCQGQIFFICYYSDLLMRSVRKTLRLLKNSPARY